MTTLRTITIGLLLSLMGASAAIAQTDAAGKRTAPDDATVTISISARGVRFSAPGSVGQVRLEVFDANGASVYNSEFQPGNVRDWALLNKQGQALSDGSYLCVVTVRGVSKRMSIRQGTVVIQSGQASLQLSEGDAGGAVESDRSLAQVATTDAAGAGTLLAHDGKVGQVVSTRGALTFRVGDFFGGRDKELMRLTPEGNLGVGVATPQAKLDVAGAIRARGGILFDDGTLMTSSGLAARASVGGEVQPLVAGTGTPNRMTKWTDGAGTLGDSAVTEVGGNVGIGTSSPASILHLAGPNGVTGITLETPGFHKYRFQTVPGIPNWGGLTLNGNYNAGWNLDDQATNGWFFKLDTRGGNASGQNNGLWLFRIPPGANPHTDEGPVFGVSSGQGYFAGSLGIGTLSPQSKLEVLGDVRVTGSGNGVVFPDGTKQTTASTGGAAAGGVSGSGTTNTVPLWTGATALGNSLITQAGGNVGIGTASPQAALDVTGDIKVSGNAVIAGNIAAKYQDVAEWVPARQQIAAGTVVILDTTRSNAVAPSHRRYDTHVAGVISAQPGVILGQGGKGQVLVATTGRVKVMVDATLRPVKIGDLLVTSDTPGSAMKSQPLRVAGNRLHRPGTIIGKALEPLAGGKGEILVLLSLQ